MCGYVKIAKCIPMASIMAPGKQASAKWTSSIPSTTLPYTIQLVFQQNKPYYTVQLQLTKINFTKKTAISNRVKLM